MPIEWNKVTWYSKLLAVVLFVVVLGIGFCFGRIYQEIQYPDEIELTPELIEQLEKNRISTSSAESVIQEISLPNGEIVSLIAKTPVENILNREPIILETPTFGKCSLPERMETKTEVSLVYAGKELQVGQITLPKKFQGKWQTTNDFHELVNEGGIFEWKPAHRVGKNIIVMMDFSGPAIPFKDKQGSFDGTSCEYVLSSPLMFRVDSQNKSITINEHSPQWTDFSFSRFFQLIKEDREFPLTCSPNGCG